MTRSSFKQQAYICLYLYDIIKLLKEGCLSKVNDSNQIKNHYLAIFYNSKDLDNIFEKNNGNEFLYVARMGARFDGHIYAQKVIESQNYFIGHSQIIKQKYSDKVAESILFSPFFISVNDVEMALNILLIKYYNLNPKDMLSIGITGTNGKTSVTQIIGQILQNISQENILKIGTLGIQIDDIKFPVSHATTPDFPSLMNAIYIAKKDFECKKIVMEVTSHGLKEERLGIWRFQIAAFTNFTQDHLDFHGSMEEYKNSKMLLFKKYLYEDGTAIINADSFEFDSFALSAQGTHKKLIAFGSPEKKSDIFKKYSNIFEFVSYLAITNIKVTVHGISGTLYFYKYESDLAKEQNFICSLLGRFQIENILTSICACVAAGYNFEQVIPIIQTISCIPGRLQTVLAEKKDHLPTVLIDYAHSPDALEKSILTCREISNHQGKIITVFGCGGDRDKSKRPVMGDVAARLSDFVVLTSDNPRTEDPESIIHEIFMGIKNPINCLQEVDRYSAIKKSIEIAQKEDIILIAGKGHENYQMIGLKKYSFDDAEVVSSIFKQLSKGF